MIMMTGWQGECDFYDPMCGSGTIPIEAAMIARNIAPGVFRKQYAFEKWADYDSELFDEIYNDDSQEREFTHHIYGYDIDFKAVNMAKNNVKAAGLSNDITIEQKDFRDFQSIEGRAVMVTNPPYGERISTSNLMETYRMIGERLKHAFLGGEAWVLSYREECFQQIGLKPSLKVPLYNGSLECEYRKYAIFDGKLKEYRQEGGIVKTEEEKQKMAEKRRSWQKRDYEKRKEENESNEEADILGFRFRSLEKRDGDRFRRKSFDDRDSFDDRKPFGDRKPFRGDRTFNGDRPFKGDRSFNGDRPFKGGKPFKGDGQFKGGRPFKGGKPFRGDK